MACANVIGDAELHRSSGGHAGRETYSFPRLAEFPKDVEWKAIDPDLAIAILSLHSQIAVGDYSIEFAKDVLDPDSVADEACDQAAKCGSRALELATQLRSTHELPPLDLGFRHWDFDGVLRQRHDKLHAKSVELAQNTLKKR